MGKREEELAIREQAFEAMVLIHEAEEFAEFIELAKILPPQTLASLRAAHAVVGSRCAAHSEGMACCIDVVTADPARYAPERVAAARKTVAAYNESNGA